MFSLSLRLPGSTHSTEFAYFVIFQMSAIFGQNEAFNECFAMPRNFDPDCNEFTRTVSGEHKIQAEPLPVLRNPRYIMLLAYLSGIRERPIFLIENELLILISLEFSKLFQVSCLK